MTVYLRASQDFQKVYRQGKRYDGVLITAFLLPNNLSHNRFGITASRKAIGNAVQRNRCRRLLRETFRLKESSLHALPSKYDWVLNARRRLLQVKLEQPLEDFRRIIEAIKKSESELNQGESNAAVGEVQKR